MFTVDDFRSGSPSPPSTHYKLSSHSYGGWTYDSIGRATPAGASTPSMPTLAPLNGPPSAAYLPYGMGKTRGTNGRTIPIPQDAAFGQMRSSAQVVKWTPSIAYSPKLFTGK